MIVLSDWREFKVIVLQKLPFKAEEVTFSENHHYFHVPVIILNSKAVQIFLTYLSLFLAQLIPKKRENYIKHHILTKYVKFYVEILFLNMQVRLIIITKPNLCTIQVLLLRNNYLKERLVIWLKGISNQY